MLAENMSLRDHFAGLALTSIGTWMPLEKYTGEGLSSDKALKSRAEWAYRQADAMLAEKERRDADEREAERRAEQRIVEWLRE